jgi:hypothetical protein
MTVAGLLGDIWTLAAAAGGLVRPCRALQENLPTRDPPRQRSDLRAGVGCYCWVALHARCCIHFHSVACA